MFSLTITAETLDKLEALVTGLRPLLEPVGDRREVTLVRDPLNITRPDYASAPTTSLGVELDNPSVQTKFSEQEPKVRKPRAKKESTAQGILEKTDTEVKIARKLSTEELAELKTPDGNTYREVRELVLQLSQISREAVADLLSRYDVTHALDLDFNRWDEFVRDAREELAKFAPKDLA